MKCTGFCPFVFGKASKVIVKNHLKTLEIPMKHDLRRGWTAWEERVWYILVYAVNCAIQFPPCILVVTYGAIILVSYILIINFSSADGLCRHETLYNEKVFVINSFDLLSENLSLLTFSNVFCKLEITNVPNKFCYYCRVRSRNHLEVLESVYIH